MAEGYTCPRCGGNRITCFYSDPASYKCEDCQIFLIDENAGPAIPVLTREEAESKRPALFGLPTCECCDPVVNSKFSCTHAPHAPGACPWCIKDSTPHVYKFRVAVGLDPRR